jgi:hypothetical protein
VRIEFACRGVFSAAENEEGYGAEERETADDAAHDAADCAAGET